MTLGESQFPLAGWEMHLVQLVTAAVTFGGAAWLYRRFPRARHGLAVTLLLVGSAGFLFACAVGLRIVFRSLSSNNGFMISVVVFSLAALLVGFWIAMLEQRDRNRGGPAGH
jgi:hypothetical protein